MRLLLLSNSTNPGETYLEWTKSSIKSFLGEKAVNAVFIPYAAVTFSYDEYESKVEKCFAELGHHVIGIHHFPDLVNAIKNAEAIVVGGGNTWRLVQQLHLNQLMEPIREKVLSGIPYIGWSAGSNIACPTLQTTNDMPVINPISFETLSLIPFQINPHYLDVHPEGFGGETREMRINEFIEINPDVYVIGLRESTGLKIENNQLELIGNKTIRVFKKGESPREVGNSNELSFLL